MGPLKFKPILKTVVWGGEKIKDFIGINTDLEEIGESWEISGVGGSETPVDGGIHSGKNINQLIKEYKGELLGNKVYEQYGDEFPILIKFIDALGDLSIQVHPDNELAEKRHGCKGKTEMWYVIDADEDAYLYCGLSKAITPEEYEERAKNGTITEVLCKHRVKKGDVFFIPAGRIHAICSGCFIAEIQQTSNITYRIFDYNRPGLDGKPRQLHIEEAKDAIDYTVYPEYRIHISEVNDAENVLVDCDFFHTSIWNITREDNIDLSQDDSFIAVICIDGSGSISSDGETVSIRKGENVLIPGCCKKMRVLPDDGKTLRLISSYIVTR